MRSRRFPVPWSLALSVLAIGDVAAQPCSTDPTFGSNGVVVSDLGGWEEASHIAVQSDGRILVLGTSGPDVVIVRYTSTGVVETGFGQNGVARAPRGRAAGILVSTSGMILVGLFDGMGVARFSANGSLDASFGVAGVARLTTTGTGAGLYERADGRIMVVGSCTIAGIDRTLLVRYLPNGTPDTSFNSGSPFRCGNGPRASSVVSIGDDFVVAGTYVGGIASSASCARGPTPGWETGVSFGGIWEGFGAVALAPGGTVVVGGSGGPNPGGSVMVRLFLSTGFVDTSFGVQGKVFTARAAGIEMLAVQSGGRILVNGVGSGLPILAYQPDGQLDTSIGNSGLLSVSLPVANRLLGIATQPDDKILAVGSSYRGPSDWDFVIARFNANGASHSGVSVPFGCANPAGSLIPINGRPVIGTTLTVGVHNPLATQLSGSLPFLVVATARVPGPCGILVPGWGMAGPGANGELLLALAPPAVYLAGPPWTGSPAPFALALKPA